MEKYLGRKFILGTQDCFSLVRDFYHQEYNVEIPDYARPENYWEHGFNLFEELFEKHGFFLLEDNPRTWQIGDVFLVAVGSDFATHAAIYMGENKILHHPPHKFSCIESYKGLWRNNTLIRLRHVTQKERPVEFKHHNLLDHPHFRGLREGLANNSPRDSRTTKLS